MGEGDPTLRGLHEREVDKNVLKSLSNGEDPVSIYENIPEVARFCVLANDPVEAQREMNRMGNQQPHEPLLSPQEHYAIHAQTLARAREQMANDRRMREEIRKEQRLYGEGRIRRTELRE